MTIRFYALTICALATLTTPAHAMYKQGSKKNLLAESSEGLVGIHLKDLTGSAKNVLAALDCDTPDYDSAMSPQYPESPSELKPKTPTPDAMRLAVIKHLKNSGEQK